MIAIDRLDVDHAVELLEDTFGDVQILSERAFILEELDTELIVHVSDSGYSVTCPRFRFNYRQTDCDSIYAAIQHFINNVEVL